MRKIVSNIADTFCHILPRFFPKKFNLCTSNNTIVPNLWVHSILNRQILVLWFFIDIHHIATSNTFSRKAITLIVESPVSIFTFPQMRKFNVTHDFVLWNMWCFKKYKSTMSVIHNNRLISG